MTTKTVPLTPEQVLSLPAMPAVKSAFAALNVSEGTGYKLIRDGEFPIEIVEFGRALRVRKADLVEFLRLSPIAAAEVQSAAATNSDAPGVQPGAPVEQPAPTHVSK
ncbi:helix-turn-helix domain-containing protein [Streptomyces sp. NPDC002611]